MPVPTAKWVGSSDLIGQNFERSCQRRWGLRLFHRGQTKELNVPHNSIYSLSYLHRVYQAWLTSYAHTAPVFVFKDLKMPPWPGSILEPIRHPNEAIRFIRRRFARCLPSFDLDREICPTADDAGDKPPCHASLKSAQRVRLKSRTAPSSPGFPGE